MDKMEERLRLLAAWRKPGGPTPKEKQPDTYRTVTEAADEITRLNAEVERLTNLANPTKLHAAIEHGDEEHRAWLREALVAYFDGRPIPADRGGSRKQALIDEMVEGLERDAKTFRLYETMHAEKGTLEGDAKARKNAQHAEKCEALILKARGKDANVG